MLRPKVHYLEAIRILLLEFELSLKTSPPLDRGQIAYLKRKFEKIVKKLK